MPYFSFIVVLLILCGVILWAAHWDNQRFSRWRDIYELCIIEQERTSDYCKVYADRMTRLGGTDAH